MTIKNFDLPLKNSDLDSLKCGDFLTLSGTIYTMRDAAHARIAATVDCGGSLPLAMNNAAIYYAGPTPTRCGEIIGSCGPTTSARMDDFTPLILSLGVRVLIGKGKRSDAVNEQIKKHRAIYLAAIGGAGALYKNCVTAMQLIAYGDLGCEAIYKLTVHQMPLIVATDSSGISFLK